jgi:hypothetical protein
MRNPRPLLLPRCWSRSESASRPVPAEPRLVYEIAIGGGCFSVAAAMFSWRAIDSRRAVLARRRRMHVRTGDRLPPAPGPGRASHSSADRLTHRSRRFAELVAFTVSLAVAGATAGYNYLRFGNPFEFGIRYRWPGLDRSHQPGHGNVLPGLYFV